jgi:hypothetical protein
MFKALSIPTLGAEERLFAGSYGLIGCERDLLRARFQIAGDAHWLVHWGTQVFGRNASHSMERVCLSTKTMSILILGEQSRQP